MKVCRLIEILNRSINIPLLWHDKMQANNSKQKGNTVSKKKAGLEVITVPCKFVIN